MILDLVLAATLAASAPAVTPSEQSPFNAKQFGATPGDERDDLAGIQRAIQAATRAAHGLVYLPAGVYDISAPIVSEASNVHFVGDGPGATVIRATQKFSGSALFILGRKSGDPTDTTTNIQLRGMTLDGGGLAIGGVEAYGLRDGSAIEDVYVRHQHTSPGITTAQSGNGPGPADTFMNEGVQIRNVWVIGGPWSHGAAWMLDGLFESQVVGGGARGFSSTINEHAAGLRIGTRAGVQGLTLLGVSVTMIKDAGAGTNTGIEYGQWVRNSRDFGTTFEGITGSAVRFDGSRASGSTLPFNVQTMSPRIYMNSEQQPDGFGRNADTFMNPVVDFGVASYCSAGPIVSYARWKTWVRFRSDAARGQQRNWADVVTPLPPDELANGIIVFEPGSAHTNWVRGQSVPDLGLQDFVLTPNSTAMQYAANGFRAEFEKTGTTLRTGESTSIRFEDAVGHLLLELDGGRITPGVPLESAFFTSSHFDLAPVIEIDSARTAVAQIDAADGRSFAIADPLNPSKGRRLIVQIVNRYSARLGMIAWGPRFRIAGGNRWDLADGSVLSLPAPGNSRSVSFQYDGSAWIEYSRTPADVPN